MVDFFFIFIYIFSMVKLSVIIVNYNVKEFLEQALVSIYKALRVVENYEIFVVDNASIDGSCQMIKKKFPEVKLIENSENLGFAKANNQAIKLSEGEYLLLINPDTLVQEDTFIKMLDFFEKHNETGMAGCKILNPDGSLQLACKRSFPTPWVALTKVSGLSRIFPKSRLFGKYNLTYLDSEKVAEVEAISGSFMMLRREVIEQVGRLDEDFFMYGEDLDWCYRIQQSGWKIHYVPTTQIIHYKGESSKHSDFDRLLVFYKAMLLFVRKHFRKKYFFLLEWFLVFGIVLRGSISFLTKFLRKISLLLVDMIIVNSVLLVSYYLRLGYFLPLKNALIVHSVVSIVWIGSLYSFGLYSTRLFSVSQTFKAVAIGFVLISTVTYFFKSYAYSRIVVLVATSLNFILLPAWRILLRVLSHTKFSPFLGTIGKTILRRKTVIVGTDEIGEKIASRIRASIDSGYEIIGFLDFKEEKVGETILGLEIFGTLDNLPELIKTKKISEVIFSTDSISYTKLLHVITLTQKFNVNFRLVPSDMEVIIGKASIDKIGDIPLVDIEYNYHKSLNRIIKRTFDLVISGILIILISPALFIIFTLKKNEMETENIIGEYREKIVIRKLKGMSSFLKNMPLMFSVFKGDLSFVGSEMIKYEDSKNGVNYKPGITGLIQINRHSNLQEDEKEKYNLYYLKNQSLFLDLEILFKSVFVKS
jgi:GT2 family glycosyltransferase/lipopolysaccharide/colanic/teichoic acid biosynthesis glycosyltransferase